MSKKLVSLTAVAVSILVAGCGGGGGGDNKEATPVAATSATPTPVQAPTVKLAPLVEPSCVLYSTEKRLTNQPAGQAIVTNRCTIPVTFLGCWTAPDKVNCDGEPETKWFKSASIPPASSVFIPGPKAGEDRYAAFLVCDQSDPTTTCALNSPINGAARFTTYSDTVLDINAGPNAIKPGGAVITQNPQRPTGGGTQPPQTAARTFVNWTGNDNGEVVLDNNDEGFKFYSDTGCLYTMNSQKEINNYCLTNPSDRSATARFGNNDIRITRHAAQGGGCIAVMATPAGFIIDLFTINSGSTVMDFNISTHRVEACR